MTRVVVADDHELVRHGIVTVLERAHDIDVVGEAADGREAVRLSRRLAPDVVVVDLRMPVLDGVGVIAALAEPGSVTTTVAPRSLVLTTFDDAESVTNALRAGASGFVVKDCAPTSLAPAVTTVAAGGSWLDPSIAGTVIDSVRTTPQTDPAALARVARLTPREVEVLALLGAGLSNADIRDSLVLSEATVKTHVSRILQKTGARDRAQAVTLAYRSGVARV